MKKIILLTIFIVSNLLTNAQNTIAKFKYEEAEQAFVNEDYRTALTKLDEAESLLKATNPKILYLKISAQSKLIEQDPLTDYSLIENTKKLSTNYLKDYANLTDNDDRYREIYIISEKLKTGPSTIQEFNNQKKYDEENRKSKDIIKQQKADLEFKGFVFFKNYQLGLTPNETKKSYREYQRTYKFKNESDDTYEYYLCQRIESWNDRIALFVKNDKVIGSGSDERIFNDLDNSKGIKKVSNIINNLKAKFNFEPKIEIETESVYGADYKKTTYTWDKNNKIVSVSLLERKNYYLASIVRIQTLDQNLAQ